jgi:capsular exopolysaccharide synthesis family protein
VSTISRPADSNERTQAANGGRRAADRPPADVLGRPLATPEVPPPGTTTVAARGREGLSLQHLIRRLRRRWVVIAACAILTPIAAFVYSSTQTDEYQTSATLLFRASNPAMELFPDRGTPVVGDPARTAATNVGLVSLNTVAGRTSRRLKGTVSPASVAASIAVTSEGESDLVSVTATAERPDVAARLANTFGEEYIAFRRDADRRQILDGRARARQRLSQLTDVERASAQGRELQKEVGQLETLAALQTGNAELVQRAGVPTAPSSPTPKRDAILGLIGGLALGIALAFLLDLLDARIKEPEEVEEILRVPALGSVPRSRTLERVVAEETVPGPALEAFLALRTNLRYFNVDREIRSVMVTSATSQDGKTTVSLGLAQAAARSGTRTLLIEADMRRATLAKSDGLVSLTGLSLVLAREHDIRDAIVEVPLDEDRHPDNVLHIIPAGPVPPNPAALLESDRMEEVIRFAEAEYELVVIDTPPITVVADAIPLLRLVSGVVAVCRLNKTRRDALVSLRHQLENVNAPLLGVVLNGAEEVGGQVSHYYYHYEHA